MSDRLAKLDHLADQFESEWLAGRRPELLDWINRVDQDDQLDLAKMLLPVDLDCRSALGEHPQVMDYERLGNRYESLVRDCLLEFYSGTIPDPPHQGVERSTTDPSTTTYPVGLQPHSRISHYTLIKPLGKGGMGEVWAARQDQPVQRQVAIKVIKRGIGSQEILARFEAERQALALMNHPNIATILDAGTTADGQPFFVMELFEGMSITKFCNHHNLDILQRLQLFIDVCAGVQHAHQKGIIHRDLKPSNIIVGEQDGVPIAKIIDFGLAKAIDSTQRLTDMSLETGIGQILGTLKYMSPEQAGLDNLDIDTRTDIFSLGVILYELLTGETPLEDSTIKDRALLKVLEVIRDLEPPKPSSRISEATPSETVRSLAASQDMRAIKHALVGDLDWITIKALENNRNRRYDSAAGLAADIQRFIDRQPVLARPPSLWYVAQKTIARHRIAASASCIVVIAGCLALAGLIYAWSMDRHYRRVSEAELAFEKEYLPLQGQAASFSLSHVQQLSPLIDRLGELDLANSTAKLRRVLHSFGLGIQLRLESPDLTVPGIDLCQHELVNLKSIANEQENVDLSDQIKQLEFLLDQRRSNWIVAFSPASIPSMLESITPQSLGTHTAVESIQAALTEDGLLSLAGNYGWRLSDTFLNASACRLYIRLQPTQLDQDGIIELHMRCSSTSEYIFRLKQQGELTSQQLGQSNWQAEILRSGIVLGIGQLSLPLGEPIPITAEFDRGKLTFLIDDRSISGRDLFAMDCRQLVCAVESSAQVLVSECKIMVKPSPDLPTSIEQADYLYSRNEFKAAKELYQNSQSDQAQYKLALCDIQLQQFEQAMERLNILYAKPASVDSSNPWHLLSGLQLFGLLTDRSQLRKKNDLMLSIVAHYQGKMDQFTPYLPIQLQQQVLQYVRRDGSRGRLTVQPQGDVAMLRFAIELEGILPDISSERKRGTLWKLADALRVEGSLLEAEQILSQLLSESNVDAQSNWQERIGLMQDLCWLYINMQRTTAAEQLLNDLSDQLAQPDQIDGPEKQVQQALILLERVRLLAIAERYERASSMTDQFFALTENNLELLTHGQYADACAVAGFVADRLGDKQLAIRYWEKGLRQHWQAWDRDRLETQGYGYHEIQLSFSLSYEMILHSLTGKSRAIDIEESILIDLGTRSISGNLQNQAKLYSVPSFLFPGILKGVFNVPDVGESWRNEMILHTCSLKDFYYRPMKLILSQVVRSLFLAGLPLDEQLQRDSFQSVADLVDMFDRQELQIEEDFPMFATFLMAEYNATQWNQMRNRLSVRVASGLGLIKCLSMKRSLTATPAMLELIGEIERMPDVPQSYIRVLQTLKSDL